MTISPLGDSALIVNLDQQIDPEINNEIILLSRFLEQSKINGINSLVPAYCSLTILFDPFSITYEELCEVINHSSSENGHGESLSRRTFQIPVCYDPPYSLDISDAQKILDLSLNELIRLHESTTYQAYMLGFLPGFAYLGKLPEQLYIARRSSPRLKVPAGSVGLAGFQTGVYPCEAPGGWQIIGNTPILFYDELSDPPFLLQIGDRVKFFKVNTNEYDRISKEVKKRSYHLEIEEEI